MPVTCSLSFCCTGAVRKHSALCILHSALCIYGRVLRICRSPMGNRNMLRRGRSMIAPTASTGGCAKIGAAGGWKKVNLWFCVRIDGECRGGSVTLPHRGIFRVRRNTVRSRGIVPMLFLSLRPFGAPPSSEGGRALPCRCNSWANGNL